MSIPMGKIEVNKLRLMSLVEDLIEANALSGYYASMSTDARSRNVANSGMELIFASSGTSKMGGQSRLGLIHQWLKHQNKRLNSSS